MAIIKYMYLFSGIVLYVLINIWSYQLPQTETILLTKLLFSGLSLILLVLDYICILKAEWLFKRPFQSFTPYTKIMFYIGVYVIPLISLYYHS